MSASLRGAFRRWMPRARSLRSPPHSVFPEPLRAETPAALYLSERALLEGYRVIPLVHLPDIYGVSPRVRGGPGITPLGEWHFGDLWLEAQRPTSLQTRLLLIFTVAVVASIALVEWLVSTSTRERFEKLETERSDALVAQFRGEYERRGGEIARAVSRIASSDTAVNIAADSDYSNYYQEAACSPRRTVSTSSIWSRPTARLFLRPNGPRDSCYKEDWLVRRPEGEPADWKTRGAFLRREELPDGYTLALMAVSVATAGDRAMYVVGGERLDRAFLDRSRCPPGCARCSIAICSRNSPRPS